MAFTFGTQPTTSFDYSAADNVGVWTESGLIKMRIDSAIYAYKMADGSYPPAGFDPLAHRGSLKAERINMRGFVIDNAGNILGNISLTVFLSDREHMGALCWFLNLRNERGELYLPDPEHRSGVSMAGREYDFYSFASLRDAEVHALVEFRGKGMSSSGREYADFRLVGFCNDKGWDAVSIASGAAQPNKKYADFLAAHPIKPQAPSPVLRPRPASYGNMSAQVPQGFNYGATGLGAVPSPAAAAPVPQSAMIPPSAVQNVQQAYASSQFVPQPQPLQSTDEDIPF